MPGLFSQIYSGTAALRTHSKGLEIAGKNLANISNPAYARQRAALGDRGEINTGTNTESMGVEVLRVQQVRNQFLDRQVLREVTSTSSLSATRSILDRTQSALSQQLDRTYSSGSISDLAQNGSGGISQAIGDFFTAFESLSANPTNIAEKQLLLEKADVLTQRINSVDVRLARIQTDIDDQTSAEVITVNSLLADISTLNEEIGRSENGRPETAIDLRDQRQAKLEDLSQYMDFEVRPVAGSNGQIQVVAKDSASADVLLVDRSFNFGPVGFNGVNFTGGAPSTTLLVSSGSLIAARTVRDGAVQDLRDGLKSLADQLTTSVNAAYNPTATTGNFFAVPPTGLINLQAGLSSANLKTSDTTDKGANELALAVASVATTTYSTLAGDSIDGTPIKFFAGTVSQLGQSLSSTNSQLEDQELSEKFVREQRDNISGVSQDEELGDLIRFQRAFQASAKYVNVADELLELVVTRLGN